ncbi:MAG: hypothetical protein J5829_03170 [Lachnospiraceae bacterium]|nr:hypothetical protein [Lachnospiraceae bacterium]
MENNDIELFCTTNVRTKEGVVSRLVNGGISYLEKWERIPFFKRKEYNGAKELCVIYVNANQYDRAADILDLYRQERSVPYRSAIQEEQVMSEKAAGAETEAEEASQNEGGKEEKNE